MDTVGIICSIIAAFAGIITVIFSYLMWRDSKRNILKQIEKKHHKINQIENQLFLQRRSNFWGWGDGELKMKQDKLQSEIDYLKRLL
ncbi:hypothetical protein [uncultured Duncaniella sp.]|uniref:hypothetical protein n=1 Tax=uncultured Duncaniella sp. TaxID=2768039 RepID=UPI0025A9AB32|nr:hypothetical protein [uncultured Duncaniella sp.]